MQSRLIGKKKNGGEINKTKQTRGTVLPFQPTRISQKARGALAPFQAQGPWLIHELTAENVALRSAHVGDTIRGLCH